MIKEEDIKIGLRIKRNNESYNEHYSGKIGTVISKDNSGYYVKYDNGNQAYYGIREIKWFDLYSPDDLS